MPHLFVKRPRLHDLIGDDPDVRTQFRCKTINAVSYKVGGILFTVGGVRFFPAISPLAELRA